MLSRRGGCETVVGVCLVFGRVRWYSDWVSWVSWWCVRRAMRLCATRNRWALEVEIVAKADNDLYITSHGDREWSHA